MGVVSIRSEYSGAIAEGELLPVGNHKVRVASMEMVDNPFAEPSSDPRQKLRLRILMECIAGKNRGKMIATFASPSMRSKVTKPVIVQLFGREPSPEELVSIDTDALIAKADEQQRNRFLVRVVPHTRRDGSPTVKVDSVVPLDEEEE
jgi:hypothetical protein